MKEAMFAVIGAMVISSAALAGAGHGDEAAESSHGHGHGDKMAIGQPGDVGQVKRTIHITMKETDDGAMVFEPATLSVHKDETVKLTFVNMGELDHEFVMDEHSAIQAHKKAMEKFPGMEHADPNAIHLAAGKTGDIVWTFSNPGNFQFACLIPGHFESGMTGKLSVSKHSAIN